MTGRRVRRRSAQHHPTAFKPAAPRDPRTDGGRPFCPDGPADASRAQRPRSRASRLRAREISDGSVCFSSAPIRPGSRTDSRWTASCSTRGAPQAGRFAPPELRCAARSLHQAPGEPRPAPACRDSGTGTPASPSKVTRQPTCPGTSAGKLGLIPGLAKLLRFFARRGVSLWNWPCGHQPRPPESKDS